MSILGSLLRWKELTKEQVVQLRSVVHYNPQKNHLFNATVRENITLWDTPKKSQLQMTRHSAICQLDDGVTEQVVNYLAAKDREFL